MDELATVNVFPQFGKTWKKAALLTYYRQKARLFLLSRDNVFPGQNPSKKSDTPSSDRGQWQLKAPAMPMPLTQAWQATNLFNFWPRLSNLVHGSPFSVFQELVSRARWTNGLSVHWPVLKSWKKTWAGSDQYQKLQKMSARHKRSIKFSFGGKRNILLHPKRNILFRFQALLKWKAKMPPDSL